MDDLYVRGGDQPERGSRLTGSSALLVPVAAFARLPPAISAEVPQFVYSGSPSFSPPLPRRLSLQASRPHSQVPANRRRP